MNRDCHKQRLITGRAPETYEWKDGRTRTARPAHANHSTASRAKARPTQAQKRRESEKIGNNARKRKEALVSSALMYLTLVFIVFMLFLQIGKLSEISGKRTDINSIKQTNTDLLVSIENLEVEYGMETDEKVIKQKAEDKLRMKAPMESNVFVLKNVSRGEQGQYLTADRDVFNR